MAHTSTRLEQLKTDRSFIEEKVRMAEELKALRAEIARMEPTAENKELYERARIDLSHMRTDLRAIQLQLYIESNGDWSEPPFDLRQGVEWGQVEDIHWVAALANKHTSEVGFKRMIEFYDHARKRQFLVVRESAYLVFNMRRDGWTTIYQVVSEERHKGLARKLVMCLPKPMRAKCPVDNESNGFWQHIGFKNRGRIAGTKRELNVWEYV